MEAILRLKAAGLTRAEIATALETSEQLIGMYERGDRFPGRDKFEALVALGDTRGLRLLASDFVVPSEAE